MITPQQQLLNVVECAMKITERKRGHNGRGRGATYIGSVDELASTLRQLAEMTQQFLAGELTAMPEATEEAPF